MTTIVVDVEERTIWADSRSTVSIVSTNWLGKEVKTFCRYLDNEAKIFEDDRYIWAGAGNTEVTDNFRYADFKGPLWHTNNVIVVDKETGVTVVYEGVAKAESRFSKLLSWVGLTPKQVGVNILDVSNRASIGCGSHIAWCRLSAGMRVVDAIRSASRQDKYTNDRITSVSW